MLSCKQATKIYLKSLDAKISFSERFLLIFHILICKACRKFKSQIDFIKKAFSKLAKQNQIDTTVKLNPKIKEEIKCQLDAEQKLKKKLSAS
ncbi:MAG: hypothetical protein RLZZ210_1271 [Pseudomonadota bacterium]|jgi:hypothetical protein